MNYVFPTLPPINSNSLPSEIETWKHHPDVAQCHKKLFCCTGTEDTSTFMSKIIDKVWPSKKTTPKVHIAYAISVCEFLLDPMNKKIQVSETPMKFRIQKHLQKMINKGDKIIQVEEEEVQKVREVEEEVQEVQEVEEEVEKESGGIEDDDYYSSENEKRYAESLRRKYSKKN